MEQYYSDERNVQILVSLLKQYGIKKIIVSPGSTNVTFVGSVQYDSYFELYSCIDERSAAYMACGLAAESGEAVAMSCTGATASRNYFPALTEAYYRKLPILAITSTQDISRIGNLIPQAIDRTQQPKDTIKLSVHLQNIKDWRDEHDVMLKANKALLELRHHGSGPVHINLATLYSANFSVRELPTAHKINRYVIGEKLPEINSGKIAIVIGSHRKFTEKETHIIEKFCETYNALVFVEPTSNYKGKYAIPYSLASHQATSKTAQNPDLLIHIGEMSDKLHQSGSPNHVWRVSEDGEIADFYQCLDNVFEMSDASFFSYYTENSKKQEMTYFQQSDTEWRRILSHIPELPFSHIWVASQTAHRIPHNSVVHLGILSPLRSWSYFPFDKSIDSYCNQGGFGIDGNLSTLIGASFANKEKIYYGIVGDLSFFYDMNCLGNRHISNNIRILLINNGAGAEFHLFKQLNSIYVNDISQNISAGEHFGCKSPDLVKHYANDLGFEYMSARTKEEYLRNVEEFTSALPKERPILFEVFTDVDKENEALEKMWSIEKTEVHTTIKQSIKGVAKKIIGKDNIKKIKEIKSIIER